MKTYNVLFRDAENSNEKGFALSLKDAAAMPLWIALLPTWNESYFADYKGGIVQIVDNETGDVVHEEEIK